MAAHEPMGTTSYWRGEFSRAREHLEEVLARYDREAHHIHEYFYGSGDPGVWALNYLSWVLWSLGYPDQALARNHEALALARELSHPFSEATALLGVGRTHAMRGERQAALEGAEALIALSTEHGFQYWVGIGTVGRFRALADQGKLEEGIAGMRAILEALRAGGALMGLDEILTLVAELHGKAGQAEEGLALVAEALEFVAKTGEREAEAEVHRVKGELLLAREPTDATGAEATFREALDIARGQSAKSLELRAATNLARLWQQQGRKKEARELLTPVYDWFTEGFDTQDLKDAKQLLEQLA
jgi:predicted ATPase